MLKRRDQAFRFRKTPRPRTRLWATIVAAALVPIAVWVWVGYVTRTQVIRTAEADQRRVAEALGQQTRGLFETEALILDLVDREAGDRDCPALRSDAGLRDVLNVAMRRAAPAEAVWIIGADGFICDSSNPAFVDQRSRGFRDYFNGARDAGPNGYYVGRAISRISDSAPGLTIAKPRFSNGVFNGVILIKVYIPRLVQSWTETLRPLPTQRMAIYRRDGAVVARSWEPMAPEPDAVTERRVASMWQSAVDGATTGFSPIDQQRRVAGWHSLPDWGVAVTSRVDEAEVLLPWRRSMLVYGVLAALVSVIAGRLVWSLLHGHEVLARTVDERTRALLTITDAMPQMLWSARPDGYHDYFNHRWYERTGTTPAQAMGEGRRSLLHPDDCERAWTAWQQSLATGEPFEMEYRLRMADGTYRWTLGRALPVRDPSTGAITRWFGTCTDIEDSIAARETLARSRDDLERLVAERTRDLEATQARLAHAQRLEALGQLAGGIAHDFNNVLQAVQGGCALIERRPGNAEGVRRYARMVLEAAERGATVTHRLLAFSRRGELRAEPLEAAELLANTREILAHTLGTGIEIRVEVADGLPLLFADKGQLETVLVNLATNARDAMGTVGTLTLAAAAETRGLDGRQVHPAGLEPGSYVRLSVSDTGTGMDAATLKQAVEPFFTTKPIGKGTGLGLAMASGFAEQSGGALNIESVPGRGTTVMLWLPVAEETQAAARADGEPASAAAADSPARILVVDDDEIVRAVLTEQLEAAGYVILPAGSAAAALALLDAGEAVDLVVSDLSMPGMDGMALIGEVQRRKPGLCAILLTGFVTAGVAETAIGGALSGNISVLRKPIDGKRLAARVAAVLTGESRPVAMKS
jgi:PAS domain S-box-containing protein